MDFNFRQYDPQIGRFLSVDPLADYYGQDRYSPYAAMGNQPESTIDPNGLLQTNDNEMAENIRRYSEIANRPFSEELNRIFGSYSKVMDFYQAYDITESFKASMYKLHAGQVGGSSGSAAENVQNNESDKDVALTLGDKGYEKGTESYITDPIYDDKGRLTSYTDKETGERVDDLEPVTVFANMQSSGEGGEMEPETNDVNISDFTKTNIALGATNVVPSTIRMGTKVIENTANYTDDIARVAKITSKITKTFGYANIGITIVDGVTNGWKNHHKADLIIGVGQTLLLGAGPVGWGIGL